MSAENRGLQVFQPVVSDVVNSDPGRYRVYVKEAWSDDWTPEPYLQPVSASNRAAPAIPEAVFRWEYGNIKETDATAFATREPKELYGWYVRVDVLWSGGAQRLWIGRFEDQTLKPHGATTYPQGDQDLKAYGLEQDLNRYRIGTVKCWQDSATISQETPIAFNRRANRGGALLGNRSTARHTDSVYEFSSDGEVWTARQAVESLLAWNVPAGGPTFILGGQDDQLDNVKQVWAFKAAANLRQVLSTLIDPRRGFGYCVRVDEDENAVIHVFSILDEDLSVGSLSLEANKEPFAIDLGDAQAVEDPIIQLQKSVQRTRVVVQGRAMVGIGTISFNDSTMEAGFAAALLTAFKSAASGSSGYSSLTDLEKAQRNDEYRGDDRFDRLGVFRIPAGWDGTLGDGEGGTKYPVLPTIGDDGVVDKGTAQGLFVFGRAFLRFLPGLEVGKDYSVWPATDENPSDGDPEFRKCFALIKDGSRWVYMDKLAERPEDVSLPSATIRAMDRELAISIDIKPRFLLFANHWTSAEPALYGGALFDSTEVLDYSNLLATVALEGDQPVKIVVGNTEGEDDGRELLVEIEDAQLVYLAPNAVVGVDDNGNLKRAPASGTFIIDDRDRLRAYAALYWAWYRKPRATLQFTHRSKFRLIQVGQLLKSVSSASDFREAGTVVSEERIDFQKGAITYVTQYANVDFGDFQAELPDKRALTREILTLRGKVQELNEHTAGLPARIGQALLFAAASTIGITGVGQGTAASPDTPNTDAVSTTFYSQAETISTYSDVSKIAIKLDRPILKTNAGRYNRLFLGLANIFAEIILTGNESAWTYSLNIKATPIIEDFDVAMQTTWNELALLSTSGDNDQQVYRGYADSTTPVDYGRIENAGAHPTLGFLFPASDPVYGFLLEVLLATDASTPVDSLSAKLILSIGGPGQTTCWVLEDQPLYGDGT